MTTKPRGYFEARRKRIWAQKGLPSLARSPARGQMPTAIAITPEVAAFLDQLCGITEAERLAMPAGTTYPALLAARWGISLEAASAALAETLSARFIRPYLEKLEEEERAG